MRRIIAALALVLAGCGLVGSPVASAAVAPMSSWSHIFPRKDNGPGLKNWHCVDTAKSPEWHGPWRVFKSSAEYDCQDYIAGGNA